MARIKIKTIDVIAKEWFDRVNGNSYFSMQVTINYGLKNEMSFDVPMQYGSGDHYKDQAFKELISRDFIKLKDSNYASYHWYYKDNNIIARHTLHENCKKRELFTK